MVVVDINNTKTIEYSVTNADKMIYAKLVVTLPNGAIYTFDGTIDVEKNLVTIVIPNLEDKFTVEVQGTCYLEIQDTSERYYKLSPDIILFQFKKVVGLEFHTDDYEITSKHISKPEVLLNSNVRLTPVNYSKGNKAPSRKEVTTKKL